MAYSSGAGAGSGSLSSAAPSNKGRFVFNGLGTFSITIPLNAGTTSAIHSVKVNSTIPSLVAGGGASSLVITINQNATPMYVGNAGAQGAYTILSVNNGDVISVVFSSASANDSATLASVKSTIDIGTGE